MNPAGGVLKRGNSFVIGVTAEVLSVLSTSTLWTELASPPSLEQYLDALDTQTPAEERVAQAADICRAILRRRLLARWTPWYASLPRHEYGRDFHPSYRDHSVHTLHVFLLGSYLYETVRPLRDAIDQHLLTRVSDASFVAKELFLEWWTLTALWHDMAYPLEGTDFITDAESRARQLQWLSDGLNSAAFALGIEAANLPHTQPELRRAYRAGRFVPLEYRATADLTRTETVRVAHAMWQRLGVGLDSENVPVELDRLTTQAPVNRPPFHDHGLFGALLLADLVSETKAFLLNVADAPPDLASPALRSVAQDAWVSFEALEPVVAAAVEAIAFHNFTFGVVDSSAAAPLLPGRVPPRPSLAGEPHLFFLALVDTLQDWDRHHFAPQAAPPARTYQPSVRSSDILLQGAGNTIRVSVRERADARDAVVAALGERLNRDDLLALVAGDAEFTVPAQLLASPSTTLEVATISARERARIEEVIERGVARARESLLNDSRDGVVMAASQVADVHRQLDQAKEVLTASDREHLSHRLESSGLRQVERQAHAFIGVNCRLPLGRVQAEIGEGGFGIVFRVIGEPPTNPAYAFKLFHERDLSNQEKRRLFRRGYDAMRKLPHENIVRVYEYSDVPVSFFMAYIDGDSLDGGPALHELDAASEHRYLGRLTVACTVAETLSFAHARSVLHRDIKPGNVILDRARNLTPVLTDFDLAYLEGRSTQTRIAYASQAYGAPEQFDERLTAARRKCTVDVYSWGALLYYLLSEGGPPFNRALSEDEFTAVQRKLEGELPAVAVANLVALVRDTTKQRPSERVQTMDEVVRRLSAQITVCRISQKVLDRDAWVAEVRYRVTGRTDGGAEFTSKTGATTWRLGRIAVARSASKLDLHAVCRLNVAPQWEGVNFEGYIRGIAKQVDRRISDFADQTGCEARRHGQVGRAGAEMDIDMLGVSLSPAGADAVGQLLAAISRAIE